MTDKELLNKVLEMKGLLEKLKTELYLKFHNIKGIKIKIFEDLSETSIPSIVLNIKLKTGIFSSKDVFTLIIWYDRVEKKFTNYEYIIREETGLYKTVENELMNFTARYLSKMKRGGLQKVKTSMYRFGSMTPPKRVTPMFQYFRGKKKFH
jgi:hypothetical protein